MKIGNTSQSIVAIPNMYYTNDLLEVDAFKKVRKSEHFTEARLFKKKDINLSNNYRNEAKKFEKYNKQRYKPIYSIPKLQFEHNEFISGSPSDPKVIAKKRGIDFEKKDENTFIPYSNEDLKKSFVEKLIGLLTDLGNGEPNFQIVTPFMNNPEKQRKFIRKNTMKTNPESLADFDNIKSKLYLLFDQSKGSYSQDYINTIMNKTEKVLKTNPKYSIFIKEAIESGLKNKLSQSTNDLTAIREKVRKLQQDITENRRKQMISFIRTNHYSKMSKEGTHIRKTTHENSLNVSPNFFRKSKLGDESNPKEPLLDPNTLPYVDLGANRYNCMKTEEIAPSNYKIYFK